MGSLFASGGAILVLGKKKEMVSFCASGFSHKGPKLQ